MCEQILAQGQIQFWIQVAGPGYFNSKLFALGALDKHPRHAGGGGIRGGAAGRRGGGVSIRAIRGGGVSRRGGV